MKNNVDFSYVNGKKISVSTDCFSVDSPQDVNVPWVHSSVWPKLPDHVQDSLVSQGYQKNNSFIWEFDAIQKFVDEIEDDYAILDVGANTGIYSLSAKYYPNTIWHLFEPDPFNSKLLRDNLEINQIQNVVLHDDALGSAVGEDVMKICPRNRGLNTLGKNLLRFSENDSIDHKVKINTIDNLFYNMKIDLIKIDTEGFEYNILVGGLETIKKYKPKIMLEYNRENALQCGNSIQQIDTLINEIEYEIFSTVGENIFIKPK
jgi:FkbM family methyltransferase